MKTIIVGVTAVLLAIIIGWAYVAHPIVPGGVDVSLLYDKTDTIPPPDSGEILSLFDFDTHTWEQFSFSAQAITDVDCNPVYVERLSSSYMIFSNPGERIDSIAAFKKNVCRRIDALSRQASGLPHSSIYIPLLREVNRMAESDCSVRIVVLHANCFENSKVFSMYTDEGRVMLVHNPSRVKELLLRHGRPVNLKGITVYLSYMPKDAQDSEYFMLMSSVIADILEEAGAEVYVGANLVVNDKKASG